MLYTFGARFYCLQITAIFMPTTFEELAREFGCFAAATFL